jgi:hypothetical protein
MARTVNTGRLAPESGPENQRSRNPTIVTDQTPKTKSLGSRLGDLHRLSGRGGIARRRGCHLRAQATAPPATAVISKDPRAPSPAPVDTTKSSRRTSEPIPSAAATALAPDTPWRTALRAKIAGATYAPTTYEGAIAIRHGPSMSVTKPMPKRSSMGRAISAKAHTKTGRSVPMSEGGPFVCTLSHRAGRAET